MLLQVEQVALASDRDLAEAQTCVENLKEKMRKAKLDLRDAEVAASEAQRQLRNARRNLSIEDKENARFRMGANSAHLADSVENVYIPDGMSPQEWVSAPLIKASVLHLIIQIFPERTYSNTKNGRRWPCTETLGDSAQKTHQELQQPEIFLFSRQFGRTPTLTFKKTNYCLKVNRLSSCFLVLLSGS